MRTTLGRPQLVVLALRPGEQFEVFRIVRAAVRDDPVMLNSLRSHFALSEEPRRVERDSTVIQLGVTVYVAAELARGTAQRFPKIGDHIGRIRLEHGHGFNFADTAQPGHLTLWADPFKLLEAITDIEAV
jgi:hypothetical protein